MRYIDKTKAAYRVKALNINRKILNDHWDGKRYFNLSYEAVDKADLERLLIEEQDGLCCYCMRRIRMQSEGRHKKNVTLEHVIPHKIKQDEWDQYKTQYRKIALLSDKNLVVCIRGEIADNTKKFGMPPYPHFLAYDNLVASCNGLTLDRLGNTVPHHCCNNKREDQYVEPLYFHKDISKKLSYDYRGHIQCDEAYVTYLQEEQGVNIMSHFLNKVRLFWKQVADSDYTAEQVLEAEENKDLRQDIIDDVFTEDLTGEWLFLDDHENWCVFSEYDWFYGYYTNKH